MSLPNPFNTLQTFSANGASHHYYSLPALEQAGFKVSRLPVSIRLVLESLLRNCDGKRVLESNIRERPRLLTRRALRDRRTRDTQRRSSLATKGVFGHAIHRTRLGDHTGDRDEQPKIGLRSVEDHRGQLVGDRIHDRWFDASEQSERGGEKNHGSAYPGHRAAARSASIPASSRIDTPRDVA